MKKESEKVIERYCRDEVKRRGGMAVKYSTPNTRGFPDRIIILNGKVSFLELKGTGNKPTLLQAHMLSEIKKCGVNAGWADSKETVELFLDAHH